METRLETSKVLRLLLAIMLVLSFLPHSSVAWAETGNTEVAEETATTHVATTSNVVETTQAQINELTAQRTTFPVHTIKKNVDDDKAFVLLILGDGFTKDEQTKFVEAAETRSKVLLSIDPYRRWSDSINIYAMSVESNESGTTYFGTKKDTYLGIDGSYYKFRDETPSGSTESYSDRAVALKREVEKYILTSSSSLVPQVSTTHIIYNTNSANEVETSGISANIDENLNISISPWAAQYQSKS